MAGDLRHGGQLGTVNTRPVSIDVDLAGRVHVAWWPSTATCPRSCIAYRRRDPGGSHPTIFYPSPSPRRCSCRSWSPRTSAAAAGSSRRITARRATLRVTYRLGFPPLSRHVAVARVAYRTGGHSHTTTVGRMIVMCPT
ncbi:MAG: hypothetical protein ACXWZZ_09860 [Solirubrobacteraceae bacterium]